VEEIKWWSIFKRVSNISMARGKSLERMPSFTRAEMTQHMANSGKRVANAEHHSIPTNFKES